MKFSLGDPHLAAMEAIAAKTEGLSKTDRVHLDFALGKAYADLKDYPRSFSTWSKAMPASARQSRMTRHRRSPCSTALKRCSRAS